MVTGRVCLERLKGLGNTMKRDKMAKRKNNDGGLVYSSDHGQMCPGCDQPVKSCTCSQTAKAPKGTGPVRVAREAKGRRGKVVTVVTGVPLTGLELAELASGLKKKCGCGGTVKDGVIEIQGDRRDQLVTELQSLGWTVKKSGG